MFHWEMPVILIFCIIGSFTVDTTAFSVWVMLVLGLLACFMEENEILNAPAILSGLGKAIEKNFLNMMTKTQGDFPGLFDRPVAAVLGIATPALWTYLISGSLWRSPKTPENAGA